MTSREIVTEQFAHHETHPVPYNLLYDPGVGAFLTRYYGSEDWKKKITHFLERNVIVQMNLGVDPKDWEHPVQTDRYGSVWEVDGATIHHIKPIISDPDEPEIGTFKTLDPKTILTPEKLAVVKKWCEDNPDIYRVLNLGAGVFEIYWQIRGYDNALMDIVLNSEFFDELAGMVTDQILGCIDLVRDFDFEAVMFFEDWGYQRDVVMGPEKWRELLKPHWRRIVEKIHSIDKKSINHCCGSCRSIMPDIIDIGIDCMESVQPEAAGMNPYELKREFGRDLTFWGGLGSQSTLAFGTPAEVQAEIRKLRSQMSVGGGYILAPAKRLLDGSPEEILVACFETLTEDY